MSSIAAVVLAAGKGTRMKSELPKPLHQIRGRTLLGWVLSALTPELFDEAVIVVGHGSELVMDSLAEHQSDRRFLFAEQMAQRGTGDATAVGLAELDGAAPSFNDHDHVLVLPGDTPLVTSATVEALIAAHRASEAACTVVTIRVPDPTGYGRIVRTPNQDVEAIVEHADATADQRRIDEINSAVYCFRRSLLAPALRMIDSDNSQGELYLTDVVGVLAQAGHTVVPFEADPGEFAGVNDRSQLGEAATVLDARIATEWMRSGVTIVQPSSTVIDVTATIGPDTTIHAGSVIEGTTTIGESASIGPATHLRNATVGDRAAVTMSRVVDTEVPAEATVGPFTDLGNPIS